MASSVNLRRILLLKSILIIKLISACVLAHAAVDHKHWIVEILVDERTDLNIHEVSTSVAWSMTGPSVNLGFENRPRWFRIKPVGIDKTDSENRQRQMLVSDRESDHFTGHVALIGPSNIDSIEVYVRSEVSGEVVWSRTLRGDMYPLGGNRKVELGFRLDLNEANSMPIYLRIESKGSMALYFEVVNKDHLSSDIIFKYLVIGGGFGLLLALLFSSLVLFYLERSLVVFSFLLYIIMIIALGGVVSGFFQNIVFPFRSVDRIGDTIVILSSVLGAFFQRNLIVSAGMPFAVRRFLDVAVGFFLIVLLHGFLYGYRDALEWNAWGVILGSLTCSFLIICLAIRSRIERSASSIFMALMLFLLGAVTTPLLGLDVDTRFLPFIPVLHGMFAAIVLVIVFWMKIRSAEISRQLSIAADQIRIRELRRFELLSNEQERLLAVLTHELGNGLSTISLIMNRCFANNDSRADAGFSNFEVNKDANRLDSAIGSCISLLNKVQFAREIGDEVLLPWKHSLSWDSAIRVVDNIVHQNGFQEVLILPWSDENGGCELMQDWGYVAIVLLNLIENAVKYRKLGTSVSIEFMRSETYPRGIIVLISNEVVDSSQLIDVEHIFLKYWRGSGAGRVKGAGLGLWICRQLMHKLGGSIGVSVKGSFVQFDINLPSLTYDGDSLKA